MKEEGRKKNVYYVYIDEEGFLWDKAGGWLDEDSALSVRISPEELKRTSDLTNLWINPNKVKIDDMVSIEESPHIFSKLEEVDGRMYCCFDLPYSFGDKKIVSWLYKELNKPKKLGDIKYYHRRYYDQKTGLFYKSVNDGGDEITILLYTNLSF